MLDAGCGSGRLTVALAQAGATVTGIDTSAERLAQARDRAAQAGVELRLLDADFDEELPFADSCFDGVTNRLSLMAADDPVFTLAELRRVLVPAGTLATALWASPEENPWFAAPRAAAGAVLGGGRADFARAFGRLGQTAEAAEAHRAAGFVAVEARLLRGRIEVGSAAEHWQAMTRRIGHFSRLDAGLSDGERSAVVADLEPRLEPFRAGDRLALPRAIVLVTAARPGGGRPARPPAA